MPGARGALTSIVLVATFATCSGRACAQIATTHLVADADVAALLPATDVAFVASGLIGARDGEGEATAALEIGQREGAPVAAERLLWTNGVAEDFTLRYDAASNLATFTVGGKTIAYETFAPVRDLFVSARAPAHGSRAVVSGLVLDGARIVDFASTTGPDGLDIFWIAGGALSDGFVLTGQVALSWYAHAEAPPRLGFQIRVGPAHEHHTTALDAATWGQVKRLYW